jgi:hypothetical protein
MTTLEFRIMQIRYQRAPTILGAMILLLSMLFAIQPAFAQIQIIHQPPAFADEGRELRIRFATPGLSPESISDAGVFYRTDRNLTFRRINAVFTGNEFEAELPGNLILGSTLIYYIQVDQPDGSFIRLPARTAPVPEFEVPIRIDQQRDLTGTVSRIDYRVMSPQPGEEVPSNDVLIAVSFFYPDEAVDPDGFRLVLNGTDVTTQAYVSPFIITYIPPSPAEGPYSVQLLYMDDANPIEIVSWNFSIVPPSELVFDTSERRRSFEGDIELTARNQSVAGNNMDFVRGLVQIRGHEGMLRYRVNGLLTSQESARFQPQNRYGLSLELGDVAMLELGHVYPSLNPLLIAGRRIMGINSRLSLSNRGFNIHFLHGESNRQVNPLFEDIRQIITERTTTGGFVFNDTTYAFSLQPGGRGNFAQTITGARIGFGNSRFFEWGLNALRTRDNENSIEYFNEFDAITMMPYLGGLNAEQRRHLADNPEQLSLQRAATAPISNLVAASDVKLNLDRSRIRVTADVALSLLNTDISEGPFTSEMADELGFELPDNIENILDRLAWYIVINENMNALPLRYSDDSKAKFMVPGGIFAYQAQTALNYFRNSLNVQYRWIGPDFVSVANNGLRRDIRGFTITDRFRALDNTLYVNLLFEQLQDNLIGQLNSTTTSTSYGTTISWFPMSRTLPRITTGIRIINRDNGEEWFNPYLSLQNGRSNALRNIFIENVNGQQNIVALPTPRLQNTLQVNTSLTRPIDLSYASHSIMLNTSWIKTDDQRFLYGDFTSRSISTGVSSDFISIPLRTSIMVNHNVSDSQSGLGKFYITGINASGVYSLIRNTLTLNAETAYLSNTIKITPLRINDNGNPDNSFDNFYEPDPDNFSRERSASFLISGGAMYRPYDNHQFRLTASYTSIAARESALNLPNDHILQFRYTYFF